jgi:hypothetical protein
VPEVLNLLTYCEFALTVLPIRERNGDFDNSSAITFHYQLQPDLVSDGIQIVSVLKRSAPDRKEPSHGIAGCG